MDAMKGLAAASSWLRPDRQDAQFLHGSLLTSLRLEPQVPRYMQAGHSWKGVGTQAFCTQGSNVDMLLAMVFWLHSQLLCWEGPCQGDVLHSHGELTQHSCVHLHLLQGIALGLLCKVLPCRHRAVRAGAS